jgi:ketosteroid isomerase-like protein
MEPMLKGEPAQKYWVDFSNNFSGPAELSTTSVEGRGDLAVAVGTYRMAVTPKKAGAKPLPVEQGKYIEVMKKQPDGSWKIVYDIWNADTPPARQ